MPPPRRVPKTKTFAGCWTCRRRKVKCDNRRPRCRRCGEGDRCEGYDVDLYWVSNHNNNNNNNEGSERPCAVRRKAMLIRDPDLPVRVDLAQIDRMLEELEGSVDALGSGLVGGFSAFTVEGLRSRGVDGLDYDSPAGDEPREFSEIDSLSAPDDASIVSLQPLDRALVTQSIPVYSDTATAELMHNYIHVVADLLQPAHHTHNPYLSLYVPKAMEAAAAGLFIGVGGTPSQGGTALFHALLAVSAFHMHRHRPGEVKYSRQGRMHRLKAIEGLQRSLAEPDIGGDCHTIMSAMLSMASIDLMEGSMTDFWIHLDGCEKLRAVMLRGDSDRDSDNISLPSPRTEQLLTICSFMSTLSRSTDPFLPPKPWKEGPETSVDYLLETSPFRVDDHSLEFTYGITATLARYMDLTIRLSRHLDYYATRDLPVPSSLLEVVSDLQQALETWTITMEPLTSVPKADYETLSLVTCHILAFHASLVIYFHTRTRCSTSTPSSASPCAPPDLHHYNRTCVTNLLAAEALKSSCGSRIGWNAMAPIVWPGFIAACEAEVHERPLWRTWWVGVQRYCIGSIAILWEVVREVWECELEDLGRDSKEYGRGHGPRWMGVLRRSGRRVMSGG
ncbi:fungal-specific transcription factor domain-containing protein [Aspergillus carlsbadensis]|nr:fungal-specific transcription factor domain-containing protein [Aspergillus carlsbadensis]